MPALPPCFAQLPNPPITRLPTRAALSPSLPLPNPPNCPNLPTFNFSPCCATCLPCPTSKPSQLALPRRPNLPTCPAAQPSQLAPTFPTCPNLPAFELSGSTFVQLVHSCVNFACGIAAQVYDTHSECNAKELEEKVLEEVVLESKLLEVLREATESRLHNDAPNLKSAIARGRPTAKKKIKISSPRRPNGLLSTLWGTGYQYQDLRKGATGDPLGCFWCPRCSIWQVWEPNVLKMEPFGTPSGSPGNQIVILEPGGGTFKPDVDWECV